MRARFESWISVRTRPNRLLSRVYSLAVPESGTSIQRRSADTARHGGRRELRVYRVYWQAHSAPSPDNRAMTHAEPLKPAPHGHAVDARGPSEPEFPGCKPVHLPCNEVETYEGRLEFWDARTETAWVCEPTSPYHEQPAQTLAALTHAIAGVRGSPIKCYGAMDLLARDARGRRRWIMQADQSVYLYPRRARLPGPAAMVVGENDFPDVILEVDYSTDVRPGKLGLYESWGFPEVWVEVPDRRPPSRPRRRAAGLTIHLLEAGAYRVSGESRAFPGWTTQEIHAALNETTPSARTCGVVERVGVELGAREGTGPEDDPLLRSQRRHGRTEGIHQGLEHERALLRRQAALRFGADTAERLSGVLEDIMDPERLAEVGEWLLAAA